MELSIWNYASYRAYLNDYYSHRRSEEKGWSMRGWAKQLGLKSSSALTMILNGQRNPGEELGKRLTRNLKLDPREESYFLELIELEKSRNAPYRNAIIVERIARRHVAANFSYLAKENHDLVCSWYAMAIREMVNLTSFQNDPHWIASHLAFPITVSEVRQAVEGLLAIGLLKRESNGRLKQAKGHLATHSDVPDDRIKLFHEQALENAKVSVRKFGPLEREHYGTTFAMPMEKLVQAKEVIRKFHHDLCQLLEGKGSDTVFHLETALFPVARERGEK